MKRSPNNPTNQPENLSLFDTSPASPQDSAHTPAQLPAAPRQAATGNDAEILTGTSAFTAAGWEGTFYPAGMKPADYLRHYSQQFRTVEVDSTFYGTPKPERVRNWYEKTLPDFTFAAKVPQLITHEKILVDCDAEFAEFLQTMELLGEKLGPLLFQFGYFAPGVMKNAAQFLAHLAPFLKKLSGFSSKPHRYVVEIRNKNWLDEPLLNTLREHNVALALTDHSWMPRPWEISRTARSSPGNPKTQLDLITADFAYVRWLGDRKGIEAITTRWDQTVVDRHDDLLRWVEMFRELRRRNLRVYAYANNHYAGNGPGTVKLFWELFERQP